MSHPELGSELSPDAQMTFDQDVRELKAAGDSVGIHGLESRVKFGLDPAAMMIVRDSASLSEAIAKSFGTST